MKLILDEWIVREVIDTLYMARTTLLGITGLDSPQEVAKKSANETAITRRISKAIDIIQQSEQPPIPSDLEEAAKEYAYGGMPDEMKPYVKPVGDEVIKNFIAGAEWQKEQDNAISRQAEAERIKTQQMCYEKGQADMKRQMMEDSPKWRRIKAGERLPCPAYVWTIAYDNYPDCFEGRLMPNIQGVKVGRDTWYLPVDVIHNLPKED